MHTIALRLLTMPLLIPCKRLGIPGRGPARFFTDSLPKTTKMNMFWLRVGSPPLGSFRGPLDRCAPKPWPWPWPWPWLWPWPCGLRMTYSLPIAYHALTDSLQTSIFSQGIARYRKNYCAHVVWGVWWGLRMTRSCEQHPTLRHRLNIWNGLMVSSRMGGGQGQPERTAWQTPTEGREWAQKTNHYLAPTLWKRTVRFQSVGPK